MATGGTNVGRLFAVLDLATDPFVRGLRAAESAFSSFGRGLATGVSYAAAAGAGLQTVAGAVLSIANIVPAAALAIPAVLGLGTAMFTVKSAFKGVLEAVHAFGQESGSAGSSASAATAAMRAVENAQYSLTQSQKALNQARKEALQRLQDLRKEVDRSATSEQEAALNLREAEAELRRVQQTGTSSDDDIERARLAVTRARYAYDDTTESVQKNKDALAEMEKQGVEGQDSVLQAVHAVQQAEQALADAQAAARQQAVGGASAYAQAMAKLPPLAQDFVRTLIGFKPAMDQLRVSASYLFIGLTSAVRDLATNLPVVNDGVKATALSLGSAAQNAGRLFSGEGFRADLAVIMQSNARSTYGLATALAVVLRAVIGIGATAAPILTELSGGTATLAARFSSWVDRIRDTGKLETAIRGALGAIRQLGGAAWDIAAGLGSVFAGITAGGGGSLNTLTQIARAFREIASNTSLQGIVAGLGSAFSGLLGQALTSVLGLLRQLLPAVEQLTPAAAQLLPLFLLFAKGKFSPLMILVGALSMAAPLVEQLAPYLRQTLEALAPLTAMLGDVFAQVLGEVVRAALPLAPALGETAVTLAQSVVPAALALLQVALPLVVITIRLAGVLLGGLAAGLRKVQPWIPLIAAAIGLLMLPRLYAWAAAAAAAGVAQVTAWALSAAASLAGMASAALAFATMVAGWLTTAASAMAGALATAGAWLIAIAPIALVIAAVALVVFMIVKYWDDITHYTSVAWHAVSDGVMAGVNWVVENVRKLPGMIQTALLGLVEILTWPYRTAFNIISDLWNRSVGSLDLKVPSWIPGIGGRGFSFPKLPKLAKGGIAGPAGGLAIVGDAGPEVLDLPGGASITPLSRAGTGGGGLSLTIIHNGPIYDRAGLDELAAKLAVPLRTAVNRFAGSNGGTAGILA